MSDDEYEVDWEKWEKTKIEDDDFDYHEEYSAWDDFKYFVVYNPITMAISEFIHGWWK